MTPSRYELTMVLPMPATRRGRGRGYRGWAYMVSLRSTRPLIQGSGNPYFGPQLEEAHGSCLRRLISFGPAQSTPFKCNSVSRSRHRFFSSRRSPHREAKLKLEGMYPIYQHLMPTGNFQGTRLPIFKGMSISGIKISSEILATRHSRESE